MVGYKLTKKGKTILSSFAKGKASWAPDEFREIAEALAILADKGNSFIYAYDPMETPVSPLMMRVLKEQGYIKEDVTIVVEKYLEVVEHYKKRREREEYFRMGLDPPK